MTIALNHSFIAEVVRGDRARAIEAYAFVDHVRRRTRVMPRVHPDLATFATDRGPFVQWANHLRRDVQLGPLVELLLRTLGGPFVVAPRYQGTITPAVEGLADWLVDLVRALLGEEGEAGERAGIVSPAPAGGLEAARYEGQRTSVANWRDPAAFDQSLAMQTGRRTLDVLLAAEAQMDGYLVVLPSARRAADSWLLDCDPSELHRALLGFEHYVEALRQGLSREQAAARYHERTTIPMSQESGATTRNPTRRRQRTFVAAGFGEQYFDMHAKPGNLTRVHIWVPTVETSSQPLIFVGHCGRHLV